MAEVKYCAEHRSWHGSACQRCGRTGHDGVVVHTNLPTFWRHGIAGNPILCLCDDCIEAIRVFASTPHDYGASA